MQESCTEIRSHIGKGRFLKCSTHKLANIDLSVKKKRESSLEKRKKGREGGIEDRFKPQHRNNNFGCVFTGCSKLGM